MLKEAIILAGGFGTRLKEVVADVPKPMALVNGKPFLDYLVKYLQHYGVEKIILSVGHLSEKITEHYGNKFIYSIEKEPLGTGGGIAEAMEKCKTEEILVLNGDSFFDIDLKAFYNKHQEALSDSSLALRKTDNAGRYGTIELGEFDQIKSFKEKNGKEKPGIINAGIYILNRAVYMEENIGKKTFSIEKDFFEKKVHQLKLYGFTFNGYFIDIGIPEDYKKAQHDFKEFKY
ncbi:MAG TPA: nucleotidyltransferase family protein [Bacteroidia bacterium]|jgi:D-glycero-alpha-D-manno-heptose 1-phosphate guanylyltransferase|nr:nucleotidyltransferase family protein [Bacteroidia bacterium]